MSSDGVKFSKRRKLPTDLVHHTHEVWGPCSYKNAPLRRRGPRVLASYCGFSIFRLHFSTLGHFHMTILATKVKFGWETRLFLFIFVLKYAVPRLQAAARTLQLVLYTIYLILIHPYPPFQCWYGGGEKKLQMFLNLNNIVGMVGE